METRVPPSRWQILKQKVLGAVKVTQRWTVMGLHVFRGKVYIIRPQGRMSRERLRGTKERQREEAEPEAQTLLWSERQACWALGRGAELWPLRPVCRVLFRPWICLWWRKWRVGSHSGSAGESKNAYPCFSN